MTNLTVLVIDTDTETIQKIMSGLEAEGYLVFTASDKDVSIKMAKKINPSLIFVNIGMSGTSGLEICKAIHETESLQGIPIIMITPHGGELDSRHKTVYGIVDTIKQPFGTEGIVAKANAVLGGISVGAEPLEEEFTVEPYEEGLDVTVVQEIPQEVPPEEEIEVMPIEEEFDEEIVEEKVETPFEEEISAQPFEEEKDVYVEEEIEITPPEEEGIEGIEEDVDVQPFGEEEIKIDSDREEFETEEPAKEIETGEKPEMIEEEKAKIYEEVPQEKSPEETELTQMLEEADMENAGKVPPEEAGVKEEHGIPKEPGVMEEPVEVPEPATVHKRRDSLYRGTKRRDSSKGSRVLIPGIVIALLLLIGGGFLLYNLFLKEPRAPVVVKREKPAQKQPAQVESSEEQKKTTQQADQKREPVRTTPAPATTVQPKTKPAPPPAPVTAAKPQAKTMYAVQLGAYRSKTNADALAQQYKQKGYDAYTHEGTTADKGTLYRVLIGKFDSKNKATDLMRKIKNKENVNAIIYQGKL